MTILILPMLAFFVLYMVTIARHTGYLTASSIFITMQFIMAVGTLPLLDDLNEADRFHGYLICGTFIILLVTTSGLALAWAQRHTLAIPAPPTLSRPTIAIWSLVALSIAICVLYYNALGYNVLFRSLSGALSGADEDVASLRLEAYSGATYLAPGYVNQFKNVLLPALVVVIVPYLSRTRHPARFVISFTLILTSLVFILGTGQRGAFMTFAIVLLVFLHQMDRERFGRRLVLLGVTVLPVFFLSTIALGRAKTQLQAGTGAVDGFFVLVGQLFFRIFGSNQEASVAGFRYIYSQPIEGGREWLIEFLGVLPGEPGSDLSNRIYALLYGSTRGTAPPSIWGSLFHNFGLVGTLLFAAVFAVVLHLVTVRIARMSQKNTLQAVGVAGVTTVLGTWVAGGPLYLLNVGLVAYLLLWWAGSRSGPDFCRDSSTSLSAGLENAHSEQGKN